MYVLYHVHTVPKEPRRGYLTTQNWSYRLVEPPRGFWEANPSPVQEQQVLLPTGLSLQPPLFKNTFFQLLKNNLYTIESDQFSLPNSSYLPTQ